MTTVLLAFLLLGSVLLAMSIGVLLGRKPISGSCGGIGAALGEKNYECDICGGDPNKCDERSFESDQANETLYVDASKHNEVKK